MEITTEITIKKNFDRIILSKEEAESLYEELKKLFEKEKEVDYIPYQIFPQLTPQPTTNDYTPTITWTTCGTTETCGDVSIYELDKLVVDGNQASCTIEIGGIK